jgi:hypothetical protein
MSLCRPFEKALCISAVHLIHKARGVRAVRLKTPYASVPSVWKSLIYRVARLEKALSIRAVCVEEPYLSVPSIWKNIRDGSSPPLHPKDLPAPSTGTCPFP